MKGERVQGAGLRQHGMGFCGVCNGGEAGERVQVRRRADGGWGERCGVAVERVQATGVCEQGMGICNDEPVGASGHSMGINTGEPVRQQAVCSLGKRRGFCQHSKGVRKG